MLVSRSLASPPGAASFGVYGSFTSSASLSRRSLMHEGERALFGDNDGVDSRAPGAPTQPVNVVASVSDTSNDERDLIASVLRKDRKAAAQLVAAHIAIVRRCCAGDAELAVHIANALCDAGAGRLQRWAIWARGVEPH